eukprot:7376873-Prymnesium_polylepis.1
MRRHVGPFVVQEKVPSYLPTCGAFLPSCLPTFLPSYLCAPTCSTEWPHYVGPRGDALRGVQGSPPRGQDQPSAIQGGAAVASQEGLSRDMHRPPRPQLPVASAGNPALLQLISPSSS